MARREVIEITCDRCGKVETQTKSEIWTGTTPLFKGSFEDGEVSFTDLCKVCRRALTNLWARIKRESTEEEAKNETPGRSTD